jgi:hypothetical protein
MRKFIISLAAAGSAVAFASPAAAQYFPGQQPYGQPYGYGSPYGNAYGYNNYGQVRSLQARLDRIEWQINRLDRRDVIRDRTADRLRFEANSLERRLRFAARNGLNPYEANDIQRRISILEQRVRYALTSGRGYNGYGYNGYNSYNPYGYSGYNVRDRDGGDQDDAYEHQRWHAEHDRDRDGDHDD